MLVSVLSDFFSGGWNSTKIGFSSKTQGGFQHLVVSSRNVVVKHRDKDWTDYSFITTIEDSKW